MPGIHSMDTGFGVNLGGGSGKVYRWNAHSFNPNSKDQGLVFSDWSLGTYDLPWAIDSATNNFNCAGLQSGNEVVAGVVVVNQNDGDPAGSFTTSMRDNGRIIQSFTYSVPKNPPGEDWRYWAWQGVGIRNSGLEEIHKNSVDYLFAVRGIVVGNVPWSTTNVDTAQADNLISPAGNIWVYGEYIWYVNYHGTKTYIRHDGVDYGNAGIANAGYIWLNSAQQKIFYVDQTGHLRRTKKASHYRNWNDSTSHLGNTGAALAGHIFVSSYDDHFLFMVATNGDVVRIGPGYLYGDMQ